MMPNIDPRTLKSMMAKMGITSSEVEADKVVIACSDKDIIISNPQITKIEAQGTVSFQISGDISEQPRDITLEISQDDVKVVMDSTGVSEEKARESLEETKGDIAKAILMLKENNGS
ncbi:nascent polypeptide-associated complex protein [Candidatus Marsarchaeota archaeon]|nr:nascent polypeptide-associated complex protein [Candidatus Marsarchaeota archaeon]MCL5404508.1 nascent polypeptide-associated complex protein [Candidatus Marsarchaeota archaeon]